MKIDREEDSKFMEKFRDIIDQYLFLGFAPAENSAFSSEGREDMHKALKDPEFQKLRRTISEMKPRIHQLFEECGVNSVYYEFSPLNGSVSTFRVVDLITENCTFYKLDKTFFFDKIDEAIGVLKLNPPKKRRITRERLSKIWKHSSMRFLILLLILLLIFYFPYFLWISPEYEIWAVGFLSIVLAVFKLILSLIDGKARK